MGTQEVSGKSKAVRTASRRAGEGNDLGFIVVAKNKRGGYQVGLVVVVVVFGGRRERCWEEINTLLSASQRFRRIMARFAQYFFSVFLFFPLPDIAQLKSRRQDFLTRFHFCPWVWAITISLNWKKCIVDWWEKLRKDIEAGPKGPVLKPFRWVLLPLAVLAIVTIFCRLTQFDYEAQKAIYLAGGESWDFGNRFLWRFFYELGTFPGAIVCGAAIVGFVLSLFSEEWKRWRQCFLFVILLGAIGPGVVSNLILKEHWGRPRPREVTGLGGRQAFEPILTYDKSSVGKSFPCGHSTMGYFFVGGFFLLHRYRKRLAFFFLSFGLCLGFFMGLGRMCQGGHFFSDVIWAGAIMYFLSLLLYYDLQLHRGVVRDLVSVKSTPLWTKILVPIVGLAFLVGVMLATPYRQTRLLHLSTEESFGKPLHLNLTLRAGSVSIVAGEVFSIEGEAWGHGVPTSKVAVQFTKSDRGSHTAVNYHERISGRFTEIEQDLLITVPWKNLYQMRIDASDSTVDLILPPESPLQRRLISIGKGNAQINIRTDGADVFLKAEPGKTRPDGGFEVKVQRAFRGKLTLPRLDDSPNS